MVGSGPAGLAAAQQLTRAGHTVVVYERDEAPGGLLRFGIPDFKLEKRLVDRRVEQLRAEGTRFRCGVSIGTDLGWAELRRRFDAVVVATGATVARALDLPGRQLAGIHSAMTYLTAANRAQSGSALAQQLDARGKRVIVIGGGDTGSDCVGTALRQGAASVTSLAIGERPSDTRAAGQPWPTHPQLFEVSSSHEEGGTREFLAATVAFRGDESGAALAGLVVAETGFSEAGRGPIGGTERDLPADLVLIAMGFTGAEPIADTGLSLAHDERGGLARDDDYGTAVPGVFVAGDAGRGQSLIVWAIAEGRAVAAAVDRYLEGSTRLPAPVRASDRGF